jgi:acetolactate synthase small subunit
MITKMSTSMDSAENPTEVNPLGEARETENAMRAMVVKYHACHGSSSLTPTGAESRIIGTLTGRGFRIRGYGTTVDKDERFAYLTILFDCDEVHSYEQAVRQTEKHVSVLSAKAIPLHEVMQHLRADVKDMSVEERGNLRRDHQADIMERIEVSGSPRMKRFVTKNLVRLGIQPIRARHQREATEGRDPEPGKIKVQNLRQEQRARLEEILARAPGQWKFGEVTTVKLTGNAANVARLRTYLDSFSGRLLRLTVGPPSTVIREEEKKPE